MSEGTNKNNSVGRPFRRNSAGHPERVILPWKDATLQKPTEKKQEGSENSDEETTAMDTAFTLVNDTKTSLHTEEIVSDESRTDFLTNIVLGSNDNDVITGKVIKQSKVKRRGLYSRVIVSDIVGLSNFNEEVSISLSIINHEKL